MGEVAIEMDTSLPHNGSVLVLLTILQLVLDISFVFEAMGATCCNGLKLDLLYPYHGF